MPMLDFAAVMDRLVLCRKSVLRLIQSGQLVAYKVGQQWRFNPRDVEDYLANVKFVVRVQATQSRSSHRRSGAQRSVETSAGANRYM